MPDYSSIKHFNVHFPAEHQYVAHVEINRADKMNAFFEAMWLELRSLFDTLSADPSVRAIVLSGAGPKAFTTGLDVKAASEGGVLSAEGDADTARKAAHLRRYIGTFQDCITALERCEKPVIAAMHGFALGLAVDMATACDVRLCARDVRFAVKEVDIGLAADIGTLSRLPKVVGNYGWVKEVALSARMFGAEEAEKVGFVSRVFGGKEELVKGALEVAGLIASKSPVAVQGTKDILNWSRDHPVNEGLRYTAVWNSAALQTNDVPAAMLSGIQKRKPTFEKL
ncbi:enoyl-CoA hydratase/isomerase family protein [Aspergillus candidus]|uniref:Enoyl-CoA hydratase/isomerase family protein n=1 Tax=Aspergillus candidus TaxID=41067 RepID=A0A2I2F3K2_ASPCN|nr:enoyl-CoA hydratase/isomerase family protein [Aspergillus candidus]PLB35213.1 enoyl-CoA hydratase/isomerase family protein [Aspergillus candidus]